MVGSLLKKANVSTPHRPSTCAAIFFIRWRRLALARWNREVSLPEVNQFTGNCFPVVRIVLFFEIKISWPTPLDFLSVLLWLLIEDVTLRAEIRNFSSSVEKYFTIERSERAKYFQHEKRNFVSPSGHVMFYLLYKHQWNAKPFHWNSLILRKARYIM